MLLKSQIILFGIRKACSCRWTK